MNKMLLMCARDFDNLDVRELKESFNQLIGETPTSYARISKYLEEFIKRREYDFLYEYLYSEPLDLSVRSCKILARTINNIRVAPISGYGAFVKVQSKLYQYGKRDRLLFFDEYLFRGGMNKLMEDIFGKPKNHQFMIGLV